MFDKRTDRFKGRGNRAPWKSLPMKCPDGVLKEFLELTAIARDHWDTYGLESTQRLFKQLVTEAHKLKDGEDKPIGILESTIADCISHTEKKSRGYVRNSAQILISRLQQLKPFV